MHRFLLRTSTLVWGLLVVSHPVWGQPSPIPPDVAARWSRLDPNRWNISAAKEALAFLKLPPGFRISLYFYGDLLDSARSLAVSGASRRVGGPVIVYVSSRKAGNVYALVDANGDGRADRSSNLLSNIDVPMGMDWHNRDLYVSGWKGNQGMVWRLRDVDKYALAGKAFPARNLEVVTSKLPGDRWHGERYMRFGPDGLLYIGVGAPCNYCMEHKSDGGITFASIYTLDVNSGALARYATGIRNVVGMDWHPDTKELFFTENGRDRMGDNLPDCELNHADRAGLFFGFPFCHTQGLGNPYLRPVGPGIPLSDPDLNAHNSNFNCSAPRAYQQPIQAMGPHTAPLGMRFYRRDLGSDWPAVFDRAAIIALHGSWDRSSKIGYRLMAVKLRGNRKDPWSGGVTAQERSARADGGGGGYAATMSHTEFVTGWLQGQGDRRVNFTWGRPVDVQQLPDGSLLVSDDGAHTVYRITYDGQRTGRVHADPPFAGLDSAGPSPASSSAAVAASPALVTAISGLAALLAARP